MRPGELPPPAGEGDASRPPTTEQPSPAPSTEAAPVSRVPATPPAGLVGSAIGSPPTSSPTALGSASSAASPVRPGAFHHEVELRHPLIVRVTHWVAVIAILVMAGSGLRIFNAYPAFHRKGETFCCYPFEDKPIPANLTFGGWLGGARHWHFAMMWVLAINGLIYLGYVYLHGEWRDLVPRRGDIRDSWQMIRFYLFLRAKHPHQGKHNALQKSAYFAMPWIGLFIVLTGVAIWKPVELAPLTTLFGGYVWARYWHFMGMVALLGLAAGHVFMVFAVDPYVLPSMITGEYDEYYSPERRNARPFYHLLPRWARSSSVPLPPPPVTGADAESP